MIFEDPDELGYFIDQEKSKRGVPGHVSGPFSGISMSWNDWKSIELAGINAHKGRDRRAEIHRRHAGYGSL